MDYSLSMPSFLLQISDLSDVQQAVRESMRSGDTPMTIVLMLLVLAGIVLLTYLLSKYAGSWEFSFKKKSPHPFFLHLLKKMDLTATQRKWLDRLVTDLQMRQPTKILLSPKLFDESVCAWNKRGHRRDSKLSPSDQAEVVNRLRAYLFPVVTT